MKLISNQGEIFTFNIFLYVLPYSKKKFITLTFDRKQDTLFSCLNDAFYYTGGVPEEIWFDNMKTVVDHSRTQFSKAQLNERFYAFSKDAGFRTMVCRPFRPQTKGSVEALARSVERLRVYNYEFYDSVELIHIVNDLCEEMNSEVSQATNEIPNLRWEMNEKEHLHKLKNDLLNPYFEDFITRKVTNEAMVNFRQCKYSVDPRYIGKKVEADLFFQLLTLRYEQKTTMVTSNITLSRWGELFQNTEIAAAILDRLVHHAKIFKITGKSYRLKGKLKSD